MVDGERGPRCTFVVFEQMFELSPWRLASRRRVRGRWRGVLDPVSSPAIVALAGVAVMGGCTSMPATMPVFPRAAVDQGDRRSGFRTDRTVVPTGQQRD